MQLLFNRRGLGRSCGCRGHRGLGNKEFVIVEIAVHASGELCGFGAESRTSALEEDDNNNAANISIGVGREPTKTRAGFRASSGLAENIFFVEIELYAAGRAVLHRASHAVRNFRNQISNGQTAFDDWLKVGDLLWCSRVLQIIECSTVGNGGDHRAELQRGHGDAFTEGAHLSHSAFARGNYLIGILTELLAGNVISSKFA